MSLKKIFLFGFIIVILVAIPLTVWLLQQRQETRSRATAATTVSFVPSTKTVNAGDTFDLDIQVDPGGTNVITSIQLYITYDPAKIATASSGLVPDATSVPIVINKPKYTPGVITTWVSPGADVSKFIQTKTIIGRLTLQARVPTDTSASQIVFGTATGQTQILSSAGSDQPSENVLSTANGASITIGQATTTPGPTGTNQAPVCTSLNLDRTASGSAPFAVTFTANGNDPDGTIQKVTFDFGDGPVQDVLQGGGIGTKTVSVPIAHSYQNPGTFSVKAILTDNSGGVSSPTTCTQIITVTQAIAGPTATPSASPAVTATPTPTLIPTSFLLPTATPVPPIGMKPGPGGVVLGVGTVGLVLSLFGALLFFLL